MFYINDEKVDFSAASSNTIAQQIADKRKELEPILKKKGMRLNWKKGVMTINALQKIKEGKKGVFTPFKFTVNNSQGTNTVVFCETATKDAVGNMTYYPKGEWFKGSKTLGINDMEAAIYYSLLCPYVKSGLIVIENKEAEAREVADARNAVSKYMYYLYNETSPIYDDTEKLISIAKAFGIGKSEDMNPAVLRNAIYDAIITREATSKDGVKFFENILGGTDQTLKPLADIQTLLDAKELYIDNNDFSWKFKGGTKFLALNPTDVQNTLAAKNKLANHLLANATAYETVNSILGSLSGEKVTVTTAEELEMLEYKDLLALAKDNGVKANGKTKDKLILELRQKLNL